VSSTNNIPAVALREIRRAQKSTGLMLSRSPFIRVVKGIAVKYLSDVRFQRLALDVLQTAAEAYLTEEFTSTFLNSL
jgi:histone H3/H4